MAEPKHWRLLVNGEDFTDDCDNAEINTPALVYDVPHDGRWKRSVLGPRGFSVLLTNPSDRLRALVDDGKQVYELRFVVHDNAMPVLVRFHMEWVERSGVRKMFGCLARDEDNQPKWVDEPALATT